MHSRQWYRQCLTFADLQSSRRVDPSGDSNKNQGLRETEANESSISQESVPVLTQDMAIVMLCHISYK